MHQLTLREVNQMNSEFWRETSEKFHQMITKEPDLLPEALDDLRANCVRCTFRRLPSLEQAVFEVKGKRDLHHLQFSLKGGRARKPDLLSRFIEDIVKSRPTIAESQLLRCMKDHSPIDPIAEMDDDYIHLSDGKVVRIAGLKDRLSRAKKKLKSRNR